MVRACMWMWSSILMTLVLTSVSAAQGFSLPPINLPCERMPTYFVDGRASEMFVWGQTLNVTTDGVRDDDEGIDTDEILAYTAFSALAHSASATAETVVMQSEAVMVIPIGSTDFAPQCDTLTYVLHVGDARRGGGTTIGYDIISRCLSTYVVRANSNYPGAGVNNNSATVRATARIHLTGSETRPTAIMGWNTLNTAMATNAAIAVDLAGGRFVAVPLGFGMWQVTGMMPPASPFMPPQFYFAMVPENSQLNIDYQRKTQIGMPLSCSAEVNYTGGFDTAAPDVDHVIKAYKGSGVFTVTVP